MKQEVRVGHPPVSVSVLVQLDIGMTQALITEINAALAGQCRAIGED